MTSKFAHITVKAALELLTRYTLAYRWVQIIGAVMPLFEELGYQKTAMKTIAQRASISVAELARYLDHSYLFTNPLLVLEDLAQKPIAIKP